MNDTTTKLLAADEPEAVAVEQPRGLSDFLLVCDHAGNRIPHALGTLGLSDTELASHIAWDIGTAGVGSLLAERLDATLVMQRYSRLVIDCNRPPNAPDSIPRQSEWVDIAGNHDLTPAQVAARTDEIFNPYHDAIRAIVDQRLRVRQTTILVALHSFTPTYLGTSRPWHIGVMYRSDARMGAALLKLLRRDERLQVGYNEPYAISDETDYTIPQHAEERGIPYVGLEIRQDLVADEVGQKTWAGRLASLIKQASGMVGSR